MKTSNKGIELIKKYEGFSSKPYLCPAGVATIGYGNTYYPNGTKVKITDKEITKDNAHAMLISVVAQFEDKVNKRLTVNVSQNQYDALVSHTYNTGGSDTLFKLVNQGKLTEAQEWIKTRYTTSGGKQLSGLVRRRNEESILFMK